MTAWAEIETALDGILDRRWYTNHGPLACRLETEWAASSGVRHAVVVTNPTIGLIMLADALCLAGEVLLSALAPPRCAQALAWAGLQPRFCDVDPVTLAPAPDATHEVRATTIALLGTNGADPVALAALAAEHGLILYHDGARRGTTPALVDLPAHGDDAGAACLLTDDDQLAARLRNIRSSYGAGTPVPVVRTVNGRLSEAQAAMALLASPARARQIRPAPHHLGRRALPYGRDRLLIARDPADRAALLRELDAAGARAWPLTLDERAAHCTEAVRIAETAVILRAAAA